MTDQVNEALETLTQYSAEHGHPADFEAAISALSALAHPARGVVGEARLMRIVEEISENNGTSPEWYAAEIKRIAQAAALPADHAMTCTCPSGDGSLRWPCPQHPPTSDSNSDLHQHLLDMLGAKDHVDAGRIIGELHAALPAVPDGMVLVPKVATLGMYRAMAKWATPDAEYTNEQLESDLPDFQEGYAALIAAAPKDQPAQTEGGFAPIAPVYPKEAKP